LRLPCRQPFTFMNNSVVLQAIAELAEPEKHLPRERLA